MQDQHKIDSGRKHAHCSCEGNANGVQAISRITTNHSSVINSFNQLANAFRPSLNEDIPAQWNQLASALILSATTFDRLAEDLQTLADEEHGTQAKLSEKLVTHFGCVGADLHSAGAFCLSNEKNATLSPEVARSIDQTFHDVASLLLKPTLGSIGAFYTYSESWSKIGISFADFLAALVDQTPCCHPDDKLLASYSHIQSVSSTVFAHITQSFFFGISAYGATPILTNTNTCPPKFPVQDCTRYTYDQYSNPMGCGSWVPVPTGLFSAGGWAITCTWTIDSVVYDVCCCYSNRWDSFWATGGCCCTNTYTTLRTRTGVYTWFIANRTAPLAPPNSFKIF